MADSLPVFALRRLAAAAVLAVVVSAVTFLTLHGLYPEAFGDTRPLLVELWHFLVATFVRFDLGESQARPLGSVSELIGRGLAADFSLLVGGLIFGVAAGAAAGAVCARHPGTWRARILQLLGLLGLCTPVYVLGMSGAPLAAVCMRMTRASIAEIRGEDFVRTARAKGLGPTAVTARHVVPVALPPVVSLAGAYTPLLIGNVILVEKVFDVPGIYRVIPSAIDVGNYPVIQGVVIVTAVLVVIVDGLVDIALAALDPRIRHPHRGTGTSH